MRIRTSLRRRTQFFALLFTLALGIFAVNRAALAQDQPATPPALPPVRVHLVSQGFPRELRVQAPGGIRAVDPANGQVTLFHEPAIVVRASVQHVCVGELSLETLRLEPAAPNVDLRIGEGDRSYPGALVISAERGRLSLVNECSLERYTEGVLAGECPALFHPEALKAMAVAARSYSYRKAFLERGELCDTTHCQVYRGSTGIKPSIHEAVQATSGLCATYNGEVIEAVYCADCGGYTEANEDAWHGATPAPYLRSVEDAPEPSGEPFCSVNRAHEWTLKLTRERLENLLGRVKHAVTMQVLKLTGSGRIQRVEVTGNETVTPAAKTSPHESLCEPTRMLTGEDLRRILGPTTLKSLRFEVHAVGDGVELVGQGFGHGVGLCQFGANGMGRMGYHFDEILKHYYTGIELVSAMPVEEARARMAQNRIASRAGKQAGPAATVISAPETMATAAGAVPEPASGNDE